MDRYDAHTSLEPATDEHLAMRLREAIYAVSRGSVLVGQRQLEAALYEAWQTETWKGNCDASWDTIKEALL